MFDQVSLAISNLLSEKAKPFTDLQGQYPGFIDAYTKLNACVPSQADMLRHFTVTAPTLCRMVGAFEKGRFIERQARQARSIKLLVHPEKLPVSG